MEKTATSGVSTLNGNFYRTQVTDNGDGSFSSTLFRTDAQGGNAVPIAGFGAVGDQVSTSINEQNATPEEQQLLANPNSQLSELRKTQTRTLEGDFFDSNATQSNSDQQGGSAPITPTSSGEPVSRRLIYPLAMDDGQDKIQFTPLELIKTQLDNIGLTSPTYNPINQETIFIGIQGSITDQNAVTWGSGELNELQRGLANSALNVMKDGADGIEKGLQTIQEGLTNKEKVDKLKGLGQIYLAGEALGIGGLLSRATGSILNPNLELLFQGPTLRTFQFQFKMSPRNKEEADTVKAIIRTFKLRMAAKKDSDGLFLKAPNVFKIKYLKGMNIHKSLNLIKVCALLNFAVDYTPNGSYMTFGGGEKGDPESSMVTYNLSMTFQEIEPIYESDYTEDFKYGDGDTVPAIHPIGA